MWFKKKKKVSQGEMILKHLLRGRTLTSLQALKKFGSLKLNSRIHDLRKAGAIIQCHSIEVKSWRGKKRVGMYEIFPWDLLVARRVYNYLYRKD